MKGGKIYRFPSLEGVREVNANSDSNSEASLPEALREGNTNAMPMYKKTKVSGFRK